MYYTLVYVLYTFLYTVVQWDIQPYLHCSINYLTLHKSLMAQEHLTL